jgi:ribosome-associated protein YbcJ (S4-like RNA binding protein)
MKKTKLLLIIVLIGAVVGFAIAAFMWNKPHEKVEDKAGVEVSAGDLCRQYTENEEGAKKLYNGKVLEVTGVVAEVEKNQDGYMVATLTGNDELTVRSTMRDKDVKIENGSTVTIKGFCSDKTMFDVLLTDCILK